MNAATTTNTNNPDRFFETETPEFITIKGGEMRFYRENKRLSISKKPWIDAEGKERIGKTVSIDLKANRGNTALISMLQSCISLLQEGGAPDEP